MKKLIMIVIACIGLVGCSGCGPEKFEEPIWTKHGTHELIEKVDIPEAEITQNSEEAVFVYNNELYKLSFPRAINIGSGGEGLIFARYNEGTEKFDVLNQFEWTRSMGSVIVDNGRVYVFGTVAGFAGNSIVMQEVDPTTWTFTGSEKHVYQAPGGVIIYNTSITKGPDGFILLYETDEGRRFSERFLVSQDLETWQAIGGLANAGYYSGGPFIIYVSDGWYILSYLRIVSGGYETVLARTNDFITFETAEIPFLGFDDPSEGINLSDVDFIEWDGKVFFVYGTGDQRTWAHNGDAWFNGTLQELYSLYWD
jgi:hypothetical protein